MLKAMGMIRMISGTGDRKPSFTLVEMLVVLAIIGMLLAISLPFTSGFGKGLRIKTASRAIVGLLHVARSNAITFRRNYSVVFDAEKGQYWIEEAAGQIYEKKYFLPSSIQFKVQGNEDVDLITFENDRVTFNPSGAIEGKSGSVTFSDKQGESRIISVVGTTGRITID
jgi:general secretion pathway protein H